MQMAWSIRRIGMLVSLTCVSLLLILKQDYIVERLIMTSRVPLFYLSSTRNQFNQTPSYDPCESNLYNTKLLMFYYYQGLRLGNLMFIYASTLGIAQSTNRIHVLSGSISLSNFFNIMSTRVKIAKKCTVADILAGLSRTYQPEIVDEVANSEKVCLKIYGYLQSFKYFESIDDRIRQEFQFKKPILKKAKHVIQTSISRALGISKGKIKIDYSKVTLVGVHIRRGDYLTRSNKIHGYVVPDDNYVRRALLKLESQLPPNITQMSIVYLLVGSDYRYNTALASRLNRTAIAPPQQEAIVDLCILTLCDHMIMTVGTFGWWAAYLGPGIKVYYNKTALPNTLLAAGFTKQDHFPSNWLGVD